jgi:hypothetical protein
MIIFFKWLCAIAGMLVAAVAIMYWLADLESRRVEAAITRG